MLCNIYVLFVSSMGCCGCERKSCGAAISRFRRKKNEKENKKISFRPISSIVYSKQFYVFIFVPVVCPWWSNLVSFESPFHQKVVEGVVHTSFVVRRDENTLAALRRFRFVTVCRRGDREVIKYIPHR